MLPSSQGDSKVQSARGLTNFISQIRACTTKAAEEERVQKELGNIRSKFATSSKALDSYQKKKYVWKLVYIHILGYDVDFGHMQIIDLISSTKYTEKQVGYLAASVLMRNQDEMMTLMVNTVRNDIASMNEHFQCLALSSVANLGGKELTESLNSDVQRVLAYQKSSSFVKKKAALTLLKMFRMNPDIVIHSELVTVLRLLFDSGSLGVVMSGMALLNDVATNSPPAYVELRATIVKLLNRLVVHKASTFDYIYYETSCPFLSVKILKVLQQWAHPPKDTEESALLTEVLFIIMTRTEVTNKVNKNNADHAILFEAINLVIHYSEAADPKLMDFAIKLLGKFVGVREPNIRYLGLAGMTRLAHMAQRDGKDLMLELIRGQQETILYSLKDLDVSIRKKALELLFAMSERKNVVIIVGELLNHLAVADFLIKEEMVLKIAILAERYAADQRWYLDTILQLVTLAGDFVSADIGFRVIKVVMGKEDIQRYAAEAMYRALQPQHVHETMVKMAGYLLGEFGYTLSDTPSEDGSSNTSNKKGVELVVSGVDLFRMVHKHFWAVGPVTKAILLHAYAKLWTIYEDLDHPIREVYEAYRDAFDVELQQRACEYFALTELGEEKMNVVFDSMPPWPTADSAETISPITKKPASATMTSGFDSPMIESPTQKTNKTISSQEDDLLDLMNDVTLTTQSSLAGQHVQQPPPPPPPQSVPDLADLMPAQKKENRIVTIPGSLMGKVKSWFMIALVKPKALLFDDEVIQIGSQREFRDDLGRILLYVGNKSSEEFTNFKVNVMDGGQFLKVTEVNPVLEEKLASLGQAKLPIGLECLGPFTNPPEIRITYVRESNNEQMQMSLRLPVTIFDFITHTSLPEEVWQMKWNELEKTNVSSAPLPLLMDILQARQRLSRVFDLYHLGSITPLWDENSLVGAGSFKTGVMNPTTQQKADFGLLAQVKVDPLSMTLQVETRASHPAISVACQAVLAKACEFALNPQ